MTLEQQYFQVRQANREAEAVWDSVRLATPLTFGERLSLYTIMADLAAYDAVRVRRDPVRVESL